MKLTETTTLRDIVRAMPEEWRENLRAAREAGVEMAHGAFRWSDGSGCLIGLAINAPIEHGRTEEWREEWAKSQKFFERRDNDWYVQVDQMISRVRDPWAEIEDLLPPAQPEV